MSSESGSQLDVIGCKPYAPNGHTRNLRESRYPAAVEASERFSLTSGSWTDQLTGLDLFHRHYVRKSSKRPLHSGEHVSVLKERSQLETSK